MNASAEHGQLGGGDAIAALALLRALIRHLQENVLIPEDIEAIVNDAREEAVRLIKQLKGKA